MQQPNINQYTQGSGRVASDQYRHSLEQCLDFTGLLQTTDRYQLLLLVKRVGKQAGFTPRMIQLLDYYMAYTTGGDWEEGNRPIVFQSLARTAMDLGVGERQVQKLEKRLFDIGAICWNDSGNHKRFGRRDPKTGRLAYAYGVDLTPLAYLKEELEAKLQEKQLYAEAWRATKREISEMRRQIRERLEQLRGEGIDASDFVQFEASYREIAYELRSHIDLVRLRDLAKLHVALHGQLCRTLEAERNASPAQTTGYFPVAPNPTKRSRTHAQKFAHKEQITPIKNKKKDPAGQLNQSSLSSKAQAIGKRTPQQVANQATAALRAHLPTTESPLTWRDVIEAAYRRRVELGISQQSWIEACGALGRAGAAACLTITDRECKHAFSLKRSPALTFWLLRQLMAEGRLSELVVATPSVAALPFALSASFRDPQDQPHAIKHALSTRAVVQE